MLGKIPGESIAEGLETFIGCIGSHALLDGIYARFADVPRGTKIRFANAKRDHVLHGQDKIEKFSYPRGWDLLCSL
jgi:hypothetical protein